MHKIFEIFDLTTIINQFVCDGRRYCPIFPTNNDELYLCGVFANVIVVLPRNIDLQKMKYYHDIRNIIISGEISLFPKKLKCLYITFKICKEDGYNEFPLFSPDMHCLSNTQKNKEETKKIVSWLESIYETLPSSLTFIGFINAKKNSVMLKSMLPKSIKYLNIKNGSIINKKILTQLTKIILSSNDSIDDFPDNMETITFTSKKCQQKITKLPKNLKTIDIYANINHPFKCKMYKNYDDHHKHKEFMHDGKKCIIRKNCEEHDFIYPIPNVTTIIANSCIFDAENKIKLPEKLDKLIVYPCTCDGSLNEHVVREFTKSTNEVFDFRKNMIRDCGN